MSDKKFPSSQIPIRKTSELLPNIFQTESNNKFLAGVLDPLVQPGVLEKTVGYVGRRYGKTYTGADIYLDDDQTLRSRYQLEPAVTIKENAEIKSYYDYLDFKNQLKYFGNTVDRDDLITAQENYSWDPPIDWDKFVNYREYYWEPNGPPVLPVRGQSPVIRSTYTVDQGSGFSWILRPDGVTPNPTLTLFRGQTYTFIVDSPGEGFVIRTNYDTGSLAFRPNTTYQPGQLAVYDGKIFRAKTIILPDDGSSISVDSQDWELIDTVANDSALDYNIGVTNNGVKVGTLIFEVPYDAPDILFYQSEIYPDRLGKFLIADVDSFSKIDVEKEIVGKAYYTSSNQIEFTNGLIVEFFGDVTPEKYASDIWVIEGVGSGIILKRFSDLVPPTITTDVPEVLFDNSGFDTQPFDDATTYPSQKDYITINRNSNDANPWSRYNRWFHRSVLAYAYTQRGLDFPADESSRAKRPIIEFLPNLKLYKHGITAKTTVDYIDTYTTDVFSSIEGSTGYSIDGESLFEGARVLVVNDTDILANNRIYTTKFIVHNGRRQITLQPSLDAESVINECVLIRRGSINGGKMYFFNGARWVESQQKLSVNQPPLFDLFDGSGVSFTDEGKYPVSTFVGTEIVNYKIGNSISDSELGFSLNYLNIDNIGDILFDWRLDVGTFQYTIDRKKETVNLNNGFYLLDNNYKNGWDLADNTNIQPIIDSVKISNPTNSVELRTVEWNSLSATAKINFYLNGEKIYRSYTRTNYTFTFKTLFDKDDIITVKIVDSIEPLDGYYEIPVGLEKNPLNFNLNGFTFGQALDHLKTSLEFDTRFVGNIPGVSNLRDFTGYQNNAKRFMKHSGLSPTAVSLLCDKQVNIIKSIQHAKRSYTTFKNNFIQRSGEIGFEDSIPDMLDNVISSLTAAKNSADSFADSDMIGTGAYTSIQYTVEDVGIKTFSLSEKFDLETLSRRAVYVYVNGSQLLNDRDYTFNSAFGFIILTIGLNEGDDIEIREYVSTSACYIPQTPTKLGLYKKFTPRKFLDDTYVQPINVIQGHDGSIITAFDDYRDDLILELEYRIYNNIKVEYDTAVFDIDSQLGNYYYKQNFSKEIIDNVISSEFLQYISNTNIGYTLNSYFDSQNSFTYTYSNMTDPTGTVNLPGYWRGVYQWFYDTDRPHTCPWEMLGFSEKPAWWEGEYGPAPYTRGNLVLWEDLQDGVIRQGARQGIYERYKRSSLLDHIPVDDSGNLLSPLDSGLASNFTLINNQGSFSLGDVGPVEYSWRSGSEYPFALIIAMCLLRPFQFFTVSLDRSSYYRNILGQIVYKNTLSFYKLADIQIPVVGGLQTSGLLDYVSSYLRYLGISQDNLSSKIKNIDVNLATRLSGFVDKNQQKYLLDSKSPRSTSSSIFVPQENYDIIFNVSSPIYTITYSGVIVEKSNNGWSIRGYDSRIPYFSYYSPVPNQRDPEITVGGISESFVQWNAGQRYDNGIIAQYRGDFYRANKSHTAADAFDTTLWSRLPKLPLVGGVSAKKRKNFNKFVLEKLVYGSELNSIQSVVDFLLGYEEYLKSIGIIIDGYDFEIQTSKDWGTAAKEFMFWTRHNWALGSIVTLSPIADRIKIQVPTGVVDSLIDDFYDYNILTANGQPLEPRFINVNRDFQTFEISTTNTVQGIYYLKAVYVLKEHITVFDDRTVFNDIIFDKTTGYRQERIKSQGFRTTDWDGDYTSPGFIFDNVNIEIWQPFIDYKLGDIVSYRSYNWVAKSNHTGTEEFNFDVWSKLDTTPEKQLIANFDYKINQFEDYFEVSSEGIGGSQRALARHTVGYQGRNYLQNLSEDAVTQFQLYQGFIREKGTNNSITKVFDKLSTANLSSIQLNEQWAFRVGKMGGYDQLREIELQLDKGKFLLNPQLLLFTDNIPNTVTDQIYRLIKSDFTISDVPFTSNINPVTFDDIDVLDAGYVRSNQVEWTVATKNDILNLDITQFNDNDHVWITFLGVTWDVFKFNVKYNIIVENILRDEIDKTKVKLVLNRSTNIMADDIVGVRNVENLTGFFKVLDNSVQFINGQKEFTITIEIAVDAVDPAGFESTLVNLYLFESMRIKDYSQLDPQRAALLSNRSRLFVDSNQNGLWEVLEKTKQYSAKSITDYVSTTPSRAGTSVLYDSNRRNLIVSIPGSGIVVVYIESRNALAVKQTIEPPDDFEATVLNTFGESLALSPDSRWMAVGSPKASGVKSYYKGIFDPTANYFSDDVVLFNGRLWRSVTGQNGDGSTIDLKTDSWAPLEILAANSQGYDSGLTNQGMISLYEFAENQWNHRISLTSPRPDDGEFYGQSIAIGVDNEVYYMAVAAPDAAETTGRVYLYIYENGQWRHNEDFNYKGQYDPTGNTTYYEGEIVWYEGYLWRALDESTKGDGSTISLESSGWMRLDPISTQNSLPQSIAVSPDGSTLSTGYLDELQVAEILQIGDRFGHDVAMSRDGSVLAVSAPFADEQYFANYRGIWRPDREYIEGEVVKYQNSYHQLVNKGPSAVPEDSTIRSFNEQPDAGQPWENVGDSSGLPTGKVFLYKRSSTGVYELEQTISADNVLNDDSANISIATGDRFGHSIALDWSASTLVVSSPLADFNLQNQGSAFIFRNDNLNFLEYRLKQKIQSFEEYPNEYFGQSVSISENTEKIVVGANNSAYAYPIRFDASATIFDNGLTRFSDIQGRYGAVYLFERKGDIYFLTEKLETELSLAESFGNSVDVKGDIIAVGSPDYVAPAPHNATLEFDGDKTGIARLFKKNVNSSSWNSLSIEEASINIEYVKSLALYDNVRNQKIIDLDYVDHRKLKILNIAEKEIKFKTPYDPATYNLGNDQVVVDDKTCWASKHVGQLWWDISKAKWINYEQGDINHRLGNWNVLATGSSIDVYEWVETRLLPSEWSALADTNEGLAEGISGQPLYPNDDVYTIKILFNSDTELPTETLYYYWIKNTVLVPKDVIGRQTSSRDVANAISNPVGTNQPFAALSSANSIILYNVKQLLDSDTALLNIQFTKNEKSLNAVHNEYVLITEGIAENPPIKLEEKMIDSLVGYDIAGNRVPDPGLPDKIKYGIQFRPRQSMFVDRFQILKILIQKANSTLLREPFANLINFRFLNLDDKEPDAELNLYDISVNTASDLQVVGTVRIKQAQVSANIIDGEIISVNIVDAGYGYRPREIFTQESSGVYEGPPVEIEGTGTGAKIITHIDNQGRIVTVSVIQSGRNYNVSTILKIRQFSVLVKNDESANDFWSIYAWDDVRRNFYRSASQAFDTTRYWNYTDWWEQGYGETSRIVKEIGFVSDESAIDLQIGDLLRVKEYGSGGWAVFLKVDEDRQLFLDNYLLVGRQNGTIQLSRSLFDVAQSGIGYDNNVNFDTGLYDLENALELRNIFNSLKFDIFTGDYSSEWNNLFFTSVRHVFDEQLYVDWAFKTSFLNAIHYVGNLEQKLNYKNDNLDSYQEYINEVKPYRTTVREYVSDYKNQEIANSSFTDFDIPPYYSVSQGKIIPVGLSDNILQTYPWKWWNDNKGFSVTEIKIFDRGSGYINPPQVVIAGSGLGAVAQAYIANGQVTAVQVRIPGTGYLTAPTVTLVGGNAAGSRAARAVAIIGDSFKRSFDMCIKFDRITKTGLYASALYSQDFTATGSTASFDLAYPPILDKSKINVRINGQLVLNNEYIISFYTTVINGYSVLRGKIVFVNIPESGDIINISFEKNVEILDSVNRINKFYAPMSGMIGKELDQLMTGIDFGGVQIQGTTFDVTGGWDALPWFTDSWDSVTAASDYYVVSDGSTNVITLPYVPADGQVITIYLKRKSTRILSSIDDLAYTESVEELAPIRIDDPQFDPAEDSSGPTVSTAVMPSFVGDGSTNTVDFVNPVTDIPYVQTQAGDILIFRPIESDGSVIINDPNIIDTNLSGGTLSQISGMFTDANGLSAEDISISGGKFQTPDFVPATEENIPGQVLDTLSIKVFQSTSTGSSSILTKIVNGNGENRFFDIGQTIIENNSIIVYVDKIKKIIGADYTVDFRFNRVEFTTAPADDAVVEIVSIGIGGIAILDYVEFTGDGETKNFLTNAFYNATASILVTVNGEQIDAGFISSGDAISVVGKTLVQFGIAPALSSTVKIVTLGAGLDTDSTQLSFIRVNNQKLFWDGSTRSFDLDKFVDLTRSSAQSSIIVNVDGRLLQGVDSNYYVYDGITRSFTLGVDPLEPAGTILTGNIKVYVNNQLREFIQDYTYDGNQKLITIAESALSIGSEIRIENDLRAEYSIVNNNLLIDDSVSLTVDSDIDVTWFSEYPTFKIVSDEYTGGKVLYQLPRTPLSVDFVWVYLNGIRLIPDRDYAVSLPRSVVYLNAETTSSDTVKIISYSEQIYKKPSAFEISKDMLNRYYFKRFSLTTKLKRDLTYYDQTIEVEDGAILSDPDTTKNLPGAIFVDGERIEYFNKQGNILSQLRRGTAGTAIKDLHATGTYISDSSYKEILPYTESNDRNDFVSDGSSLIIGPLPFIPTKTEPANWYRSTIPAEYGQANTIEVFVGGRRLKKTWLTEYDESIASYSPAGDRQVEADFSVSGTDAFIRLTEAPSAGTRITIIRKTGSSWYDRGTASANSGVSLLDNQSPIAKFIADKVTRLPE
jgi:hypothetical protein